MAPDGGDQEARLEAPNSDDTLVPAGDHPLLVVVKEHAVRGEEVPGQRLHLRELQGGGAAKKYQLVVVELDTAPPPHPEDNVKDPRGRAAAAGTLDPLGEALVGLAAQQLALEEPRACGLAVPAKGRNNLFQVITWHLTSKLNLPEALSRIVPRSGAYQLPAVNALEATVPGGTLRDGPRPEQLLQKDPVAVLEPRCPAQKGGHKDPYFRVHQHPCRPPHYFCPFSQQ